MVSKNSTQLHLLLHIFLALLVSPTMISKVLRMIIMGPPGSGKGTVSNRIVKDFGLKHLSSGDLLRAQILNKTAAGLQAHHFIEAGHLVPDDVMVKLVLNELENMRNVNWLLDGFPRTVPQSTALLEREPVDVVVNLAVPFEVIIDRIKGRMVHPGSGRIYHNEFNPPKVTGKDDLTGEDLVQRDDDKPATVRNRLETYQRLTQPLLEYYRNEGLLQEFIGNYTNEIWPKVHDFLATKTEPLQYTQYN